MIVGFTGTQKGMSSNQINDLMTYLSYGVSEFHHGDCIGADEEAHHIAKNLLGIWTVIHPPEDDKKRAFCDGDIILKSRPYLYRNHLIVDACELLIATPEGAEKLRSGTWATIRYAKKIGKDIIIIQP